MKTHSARFLPRVPTLRSHLLARAAAWFRPHALGVSVNRGLRALVACGLLASCSSASDSTTQPFAINVRVESDPAKPLAGARIVHGSNVLGRTAADGSVRVALRGKSGEVVALRVACPDGFASPEQTLAITLRPLVGPAVVPQYRARCEPLLRTLVVAVRAKGGSDLPIKHMGREIARTDAQGAAHALLQVPPSEQVTLVLDTSAQDRERLRPKSPEFTLTMPASDQLAVFDQTFSEALPPIVKHRQHRAAPLGPVKIERRP